VIGIAGADARLLIRSAVPTAIAGAVALVIGLLVAGGRGALGALLAVVVVALFFTASLVIVGWVSRVRPAALMPAAVGTFLGKIVLLLVLIAALNGTKAFNTKVFGFTAIACVLVWTAGQVAALARRMPYVEPAPGPEAERGSGAEAASGTGNAPHDPGAGSDAVHQEHSMHTGGDR
jgi:ATP synthase protein I